MAEEQSTEDLEAKDCEMDEEMSDNEDNRSASDEEEAGEEQHEFEIIDQVDSDEGEDGGKPMENGHRKGFTEGGDNGDESSDTDFDDSQLHELLEKGIDKDSITTKKGGEDQPTDDGPIIRNKIVLQELESDPFDILPEGWVCATHNCGMPVYLHKESRVCTMARPYYLGSASTRKHDIPISAIPCLQYRNQLRKIDKGNTPNGGGSDDVVVKREPPNPAGEMTQEAPNVEKVTGQSTRDYDENCHPQSDALPANSDPSPQKMWMVTQDSSGKSPSHREPEELHTGKTNFVDEMSQVEPDSALSTSHSNNIGDNTPGSPDGENIDVTLHSSTGLDPNDEDKQSLCCQESDREKDISITKDCLDKISVSKLMNGNADLEEGECVDDDVSNSDVSPEQGETSSSVSCVNNIEKENPSVFDSSQNIVSEETSCNVDSSELVISNSSRISSIKRKVEDLKRRGGKQRKLSDGKADEASSQNESNIAVDTLSGPPPTSPPLGPDDQLRLHTAEVKIKTAEERAIESLLDTETVHTYCSQLFQFKTIVVKKYRTWRERRKHLGGRNRNHRPELPSTTRLITCPIAGNNNANGSSGVGKKKEFVLNPSGKSFLCILHEYMQRTLKIQPTYVFKELENSKTPYGATVMINTIEYGTGYASSKKMAKQEAAKETLKILIPDLSTKITEKELKHTVSDLSFFDEIKVEDPRVYELGNKVGQPSPFQLLRECLRRNFGMGATQCSVKTTALKNQKCEFSIQVGKHSATVVAKNKRDGKQLAAQAILAKLHPHVPSWGSLLRLYATNVEKPMEKVEEMNEIKTHVPNKAVLESLREEMKKLHKQKEAIQSKGKMVIATKDLPSKMSCVDL